MVMLHPLTPRPWLALLLAALIKQMVSECTILLPRITMNPTLTSLTRLAGRPVSGLAFSMMGGYTLICIMTLITTIFLSLILPVPRSSWHVRTVLLSMLLYLPSRSVPRQETLFLISTDFIALMAPLSSSLLLKWMSSLKLLQINLSIPGQLFQWWTPCPSGFNTRARFPCFEMASITRDILSCLPTGPSVSRVAVR